MKQNTFGEMKRWHTILLLCFSFNCCAQPVFDVIQITGLQSPAGSAPVENRNAIRSLLAQANVPVQWNARNTTVINPSYEERSFEIAALNFHRRFYSTALLINHRLVLNDTTRHFLFAGALRHYSEADLSPSNRTLTPAFAALYGKQLNERVTLRFGAYYSREFFGNFWLPLIGFDWRASSRLWCWGILPRYAVADYAITRHLHACLFYKGTTDSYRIQRSDYFAIIEGQLRIGLEYYIPRTKFVITTDAGHSAARQFLWYDNVTENERTLDPSDGWLFRAGIQYRIITNSNFHGPYKR